MGLNIAVLNGGTSHERDVSLNGGRAIAAALNKKGYRATLIDVGPDIAATISAIRACDADIAFNTLHGPLGEDGAIQGVLEWMGLPYTHSDVRTSSLAMNKAASRQVFEKAGIPVAKGRVISCRELSESHPFPTPYVIKPIAEGSSFGVHIVKGDAAAAEGQRKLIANSWEYGDFVLVEQFIPGRELTVGVMGDKALTVTDIVSRSDDDGFYDYHAKYAAGGSTHELPARIPAPVFARALALAKSAHASLNCRGATRADFRFDETNGEDGLYILEVNTQPGMTPTSLLPEQAAHCGISFPELCAWIVQDGWARRTIKRD